MTLISVNFKATLYTLGTFRHLIIMISFTRVIHAVYGEMVQ